MFKLNLQWSQIFILILICSLPLSLPTFLPAETLELNLHLPNPFNTSLKDKPLLDGLPHNNFQTGTGVDEFNISHKRMDLNRIYFKSFISDLGYTFNSPFRWNGKQWLSVATIAAITAVIYQNDDGLMSWIQRNHTDTTDKIADIVEKMGNYRGIVSSILLWYTYGAVFKDPKAREAAVMAIKCATISGVVVHLLKGLTGRKRPTKDGLGSSTIWKGPILNVNKGAFPSGHSAAAFSIATALSMQYKKTWFTILTFSGATLTALSRIHDRRHWASDIFIGSILGYFISRSIMKRKENKNRGPRKQIHIMPLIEKDSYGLSMYYSF